MFGGSTLDFTRISNISDNSKGFVLFDSLSIFRFDPVDATSYLRELSMIGDRPLSRAGVYLFSFSDRIVSSGGITRDFRVQSSVSASSLSVAHPNLTKVYGDLLNGGVVGSISAIFVLAQTVMLKPALACELCISALVEGEGDGAPSYNLLFQSEGTNEELQAAVYSSSFIPVVSGIYRISVSTMGSSAQDGTPFVQSIQIQSGPTCASTSRFTNTESAIAGSNFKFVVECYDAFSNRRPGGDIVYAIVHRMQAREDAPDILVSTTDQSSHAYVDLKSGSHEMLFSATRSATYSIESKIGTRIIENRAFDFFVVPKHPHCQSAPGACNTIVIGNLDSALAGQATSKCVRCCFQSLCILILPQTFVIFR